MSSRFAFPLSFLLNALLRLYFIMIVQLTLVLQSSKYCTAALISLLRRERSSPSIDLFASRDRT